MGSPGLAVKKDEDGAGSPQAWRTSWQGVPRDQVTGRLSTSLHSSAGSQSSSVPPEMVAMGQSERLHGQQMPPVSREKSV